MINIPGWGGGGPDVNQIEADNQRRHDEDLAMQWWINEQANQKEGARLAGIEKNLGLIEGMFGGLSFDEFGNAVYGLNKDFVTDQHDEGQRELGFRLARAGLSGGSVEADKEVAMEKRLGESLQGAQSYADNLMSQLEGQANQLQSSYSGLAATGAPISGSSVLGGIQGLSGSAPSLDPGLQDAFRGIYEQIGNVYPGALPGSKNPLAAQNEFSSFRVPNPNQQQQGTIVNT